MLHDTVVLFQRCGNSLLYYICYTVYICYIRESTLDHPVMFSVKAGDAVVVITIAFHRWNKVLMLDAVFGLHQTLCFSIQIKMFYSLIVHRTFFQYFS